MKKTTLILFLTALVALPLTNAFAEHGEDYGYGRGSGRGNMASAVSRLAARLNRSVQFSNLRWSIRSAVSNFNNAAQKFAQCQGLRPIYNEHGRGRGRGNCGYARNRVRSSFGQVSRYLNDAREYNRVYRIYSRLSGLVYSL